MVWLEYFRFPLCDAGVISKMGVLTPPLCSLHDISLSFALYSRNLVGSWLKQEVFLLTIETGPQWSAMLYQIQVIFVRLITFLLDPPPASPPWRVFDSYSFKIQTAYPKTKTCVKKLYPQNVSSRNFIYLTYTPLL